MPQFAPGLRQPRAETAHDPVGAGGDRARPGGRRPTPASRRRSCRLCADSVPIHAHPGDRVGLPLTVIRCAPPRSRRLYPSRLRLSPSWPPPSRRWRSPPPPWPSDGCGRFQATWRARSTTPAQLRSPPVRTAAPTSRRRPAPRCERHAGVAWCTRAGSPASRSRACAAASAASATCRSRGSPSPPARGSARARRSARSRPVMEASTSASGARATRSGTWTRRGCCRRRATRSCRVRDPPRDLRSRGPRRGLSSPDRGSRGPRRGRSSPDRGSRGPRCGRSSPDRGSRARRRRRSRQQRAPSSARAPRSAPAPWPVWAGLAALLAGAAGSGSVVLCRKRTAPERLPLAAAPP